MTIFGMPLMNLVNYFEKRRFLWKNIFISYIQKMTRWLRWNTWKKSEPNGNHSDYRSKRVYPKETLEEFL